MKKTIIISATAVLAFAALVGNGQQTSERYEGVLSKINDHEITLDSEKSFRFDPKLAKCFDFRGDKTTCETLIAIGYADKARITLLGGIVQRVDILELQQ